MALDALAAAALADDLGAFAGARVQDITAVDAITLCFELYAGERRYLTLSAAPDHPGVLVERMRTRRGAGSPAPLALACRARLEGARLSAVVQPPHERILHFQWRAAEPLTLIAELTGRLANLILIDADGTVIAAAHRVTAAQTRARTIAPGQPYAPPPAPPLKRPPQTVTASDIASWQTLAPDGPAWRTLVDHVMGVSPLAAREAVFRAQHDANLPSRAADADALCAALATLTVLPASHAWAPSVAVRRAAAVETAAVHRPTTRGQLADDAVVLAGADTSLTGGGDPGGTVETVIAWAPYALTHLAAPDVTVEPVPTTLDAVARAHASHGSGDDAYRTARAAVLAALAEASERARRRRASLEHQLAGAEPGAVAALQLAGEMILSFQWQIAPGATALVAPLEPPMTIALDPSLSPVANAQAYFDRYQRARRAGQGVPQRVAVARAAEATLAQLATDAALAENRAEIDAVLDLLAASGLAASPIKRRAAPTDATGRPRRLISSDGLTILIGRNSRQNETVTFKLASRGDAWLHARDVPGAHVVVKSGGLPVPDRTLDEAAALAAWFSAARDASAADVSVTDPRHVRRLGGGGPGMVTIAHAQTRTVRPASPDALELSEDA